MSLKKLAIGLVTVALTTLSLSVISAQDTVTVVPVSARAHRTVDLRHGPHLSFTVAGSLGPAQLVPVTGRSDSLGSWLRIDLAGSAAWVPYSAVSITGDLNRVPVVASPPLPSAASAQPTADPIILQRAAQSDVYATAYRRVNVRSGPGTDFPPLGVLVPGESADIIGTSGEDNEWLQIDYYGQSGWVAYFVVYISGDVSALDVAAPRSARAAGAINSDGIDHNQVIVITRFNTNLRAQPDRDAEILDVVPYATTLPAAGRTSANDWLQVTYDGQTGWLIASLVNTGVSDIDSLPVAPPNPEATELPSS